VQKVTVLMLHDFILHIFQQSQMEKECLVITLLYIERVLFSASAPSPFTPHSPSFSFYLTSLNWRAFIASSLLVASKMWDDFSMINADFVSILTHMNRNQQSTGRAVGIAASASSSATLTPFCFSPSMHLDITRVNKLEAKFLSLLRFNACVTGEDYARVFFRITVSD
jgi:hypothetical protein